MSQLRSVALLAVVVSVFAAHSASAVNGTQQGMYAAKSPSAAVKIPAVRLETVGAVYTIKKVRLGLLTVRDAQNKTYVATVDDSTVLLNKASRKARLGELKAGHRVRIKGTPSDANNAMIAAKEVMDLSLANRAVKKK